MTAVSPASAPPATATQGDCAQETWPLPLVFLAVLAWTLAVNLPFLRFEDADDGFFLEVAHLWARGLPPYVAAFDIKGPGFYALLAPVTSLFAPTLTTLKLVGVAGSAVAATVLFQIAARYGRAVAMLCAAVYPILLIVNGDAVYQVMNAFLLTGYALALAERPSFAKTIGAGLAIGFACSIKQTCAVDALAALYFLLARNGAGRLRTALAFGASAAVAPLAFLAYFASIGAAGVFFQDVVLAALGRSDGLSPGAALYALLEWLMPFSALVIVLPVALLNLGAMPGRRPVRPLAVWLAFAVAALALQRAGYRTYVVPLIAPMSMLAAVYVDGYFARLGDTKRHVALAAYGALIFAGALVGHGSAILRRMPTLDGEALKLMSASLAAAHATPDDRLLVLNGAPWLNLAANLAPPTAFFHPGHLQCDFPGAGLSALQANFAARPRFIMLENPGRRPLCEGQATADALEAGLLAQYGVIDQGRTERTGYRLYELRR